MGAAAYRAGERLRDDRTNEVHNHSRRKDVRHSEIMLPSELAGENMDWARNRASLWNSVENAEARKNARVAREIQVNLPHELPQERRVELARTFSQEVADHYKIAVDLAVHEPRPSGDPRNHHAHLLMTTREVSPEGLGAKAGLELSAHERARLGLPNGSHEYTAIRERWATMTNEALEEASIEARVDHRSLAEQGIDREPKPHIPFAAYKIERAGKYSDVAESIRADYNARVQARVEQQAQRETDAPAPQSAQDSPSKSLEDIRREARENWLKMRAQQPAASAEPPAPVDDRQRATQPAPADNRRLQRTAQPAAAPRDTTASTTPTPTRTPDNDHQP